jgi:D-alanyl-D-alanine carboxypeptidase
VLVMKGNRVVFNDSFGYAQRDTKYENDTLTQYRIGSMNKMFTAVAIMQLVEAGKVKLNDPLGTYLTDYPNADVAAKVTLEHLLTHTGGTGDVFGPEFVAHRLELRETKDVVALFGKRGLEFEPGARFAYSNYGYMLLGAVIEKVSGENYYDYVRKHIFKPAKMSNTDSLPEDVKVKYRSTGYMLSAEGLKPNTDTLPYRGMPAGGGYSTVEDLSRFAGALTSHKLLNAADTAAVTTGKVAMGPHKYAYGFIDASTDDGTRYFGHEGGAPGMNGDLRVFPTSGYVVTVLSNYDPPAAANIASFISDRLPAK